MVEFKRGGELSDAGVKVRKAIFEAIAEAQPKEGIPYRDWSIIMPELIVSILYGGMVDMEERATAYQDIGEQVAIRLAMREQKNSMN